MNIWGNVRQVILQKELEVASAINDARMLAKIECVDFHAKEIMFTVGEVTIRKMPTREVTPKSEYASVRAEHDEAFTMVRDYVKETTCILDDKSYKPCTCCIFMLNTVLYAGYIYGQTYCFSESFP